jgi:hypothetical protein
MRANMIITDKGRGNMGAHNGFLYNSGNEKGNPGKGQKIFPNGKVVVIFVLKR